MNDYALHLASTEIVLGGILHQFHIPWSGQFLSLNQLYLLNLATQTLPIEEALTSPLKISLMAAGLKGSMGSGKKITPMLAIVMQGALFQWGMKCNRIIAAILLSLWGIVQMLAVYLFTFQHLIWNYNWIRLGILALVILKVFVAIMIVLLGERLKIPWKIKSFQDKPPTLIRSFVNWPFSIMLVLSIFNFWKEHSYHWSGIELYVFKIVATWFIFQGIALYLGKKILRSFQSSLNSVSKT